jgi:hypothetical protein
VPTEEVRMEDEERCGEQCHMPILQCPHVESNKYLCDRLAGYQVDGTVYCAIHARRLMVEKGS